MATPVLSRLSRVLVWAKAGSTSPNVRSSSDNFFIPLLVGADRAILQQLRDSKPQRAEALRASQPPVACNGSRRPVGVIQTARARALSDAPRGLLKTNSPWATLVLRN